jgi:DNA repair protein RadD
MNRMLHEHQVRGIDLVRASLMAGKKRPMLQAPTGAGKTIQAAKIIERARVKNKRVLFTVPALSLVDQTVVRLDEEGIMDVGVIQANHQLTNSAMPVQVASMQTLMKRGVAAIPQSDIVLVDEAHKDFDFYDEWMNDPNWINVPFVGMSATPWTRGLGKRFDDLLIATTTAELIAKGFLSPFRVYAPNHPDLTGVKTVAGDYHEGQLAEVMSEPTLTADIVTTWRNRAENRPTLCFAVDRAHAKKIQLQFESEGIRCGYCDAFTPKQERARLRHWFHTGEVNVVVSIGTLTMGIDWDVRCIVLARPTRSEMLFVQIIGRGLRTAEGKDHCLILDHSDTTLRLGFVTDIHHDKLDDGKPRTAAQRDRKVPLPKECPGCGVLKPLRQQVCHSCGFKPEARSGIECEEGELIEFGEKQRKITREVKQLWFSMLQHIAHARGYKSGWALQKYKTKFGAWPTGLNRTATREPSAEVLSWVRSQNIRYAKERKVA